MSKAYESERVIRGGGWYSYAVLLRSAYRSYDSPSYRYGDLGFRLVRTSRNVDPKGPESGSGRVIRGGSWNNFAVNLRSASRYSNSLSLRGNALGFRLVRTSRNVDPKGPESGSYRVVRGGGWAFGAVYCRSAYRSYASPSSRYGALGLRLVRTSRSTLSSHTLALSPNEAVKRSEVLKQIRIIRRKLTKIEEILK